MSDSKKGCSFTFSETDGKTNKLKDNLIYKLTVVKNKRNDYDNNKYIDVETDIDSYIMSIDEYTRYYSPVILREPIFIGKYNNDDIDKCELLSIYDESYDDDGEGDGNSQNEIRSQIITEKTRYVGDKNIIEQVIDDSKKSVIGGIRSLLFMNESMLDGITKLHELENPVVHCNLRSDNIIIDKYVGTPVIVNFGKSVFIKNVLDGVELFKYIYEIDYKTDKEGGVSLEFYLLSYIVHNVINVSLSKPFQSRETTEKIGEDGVNELMDICMYFLRTNKYVFSNKTYNNMEKYKNKPKKIGINGENEYMYFMSKLCTIEKKGKDGEIIKERDRECLIKTNINLNEMYDYYKRAWCFIDLFKDKTWGDLVMVLTKMWRKWDIYSLYDSLFISVYKSYIESGSGSGSGSFKIMWLFRYFAMLRGVLTSLPESIDVKNYYDEGCIKELMEKMREFSFMREDDLSKLCDIERIRI